MQATAPPLDEPVVHEITPRSGRAGLGLRELWHYRELVVFLTWRIVLVRYKQTLLGVAWAAIQPLMLMIVLSLFFGSFAKKAGIPGPIFFFAGLVPWTFFANAVTQSSNSLVGNSNLLGKVYFPRMAAPIAALFATVLDFVIAFAILIGLMVWYGIYPRPLAIVVVPGLLLLAFLTAFGAGLLLSALNVAYRDVAYVIPFAVQIGLFASGVAFSASTIREPWRTILGINPIAGVITGFRWALLDRGPSVGPMLGVSALVTVALLVVGGTYFRRMEQTFADVI